MPQELWQSDSPVEREIRSAIHSQRLPFLRGGGLEEHNDLNVIFEGYNITLFRNLSHTARAYTVNLDDYLTTPSPQDPLGNLYVLGYGIKEAFSSGLAGSGKK